MKKYTLRVTGGEVQSLHVDSLGLRNLGRIGSRRVSNVEWDEQRQEWVAVLVNGAEIAAGPDRGEVLEEEVRHVNQRITAGTVEALFDAEAG